MSEKCDPYTCKEHECILCLPKEEQKEYAVKIENLRNQLKKKEVDFKHYHKMFNTLSDLGVKTEGGLSKNMLENLKMSAELSSRLNSEITKIDWVKYARTILDDL